MRQVAALGAALILAGCEAATRYDTGLVALDLSDPAAFAGGQQPTGATRDAEGALVAADYARAEALLEAALADSPKDPYALLSMGTVMHRTGRPAEAAELYRSAMRYGAAAPAAGTIDERGELDPAPGLTVAQVARDNLGRLEGL